MSSLSSRSEISSLRFSLLGSMEGAGVMVRIGPCVARYYSVCDEGLGRAAGMVFWVDRTEIPHCKGRGE